MRVVQLDMEAGAYAGRMGVEVSHLPQLRLRNVDRARPRQDSIIPHACAVVHSAQASKTCLACLCANTDAPQILGNNLKSTLVVAIPFDFHGIVWDLDSFATIDMIIPLASNKASTISKTDLTKTQL